MKKILLVLILITVLSAGNVFADHPEGFGIGIVAGGSGRWETRSIFFPHVGLTLKFPVIPVYWGFGLEIYEDYAGMNITGDYYIIDRELIPDIGLNWYLGLGGWFNSGFAPDETQFGIGIRVPIGLNWQIGLGRNTLEIFLNVAPSLGLYVVPKFQFPAGGWPIELGARFWF